MIDRQADLQNNLKLLYEQLAGTEKAKILSGSEDQPRLQQKIRDLRGEIDKVEGELAELTSNSSQPSILKSTTVENKDQPISTLNGIISNDVNYNKKQVSIFCSISNDSSDLRHLKSLKEYLFYLKSSSEVHHWDRTESFGGQIRNQYIKEKIDTSSIFIIFVSPAYFNFSESKYEFQEIGKAYAAKRSVMPIIIPVISRPTNFWENQALTQNCKLGEFVYFPKQPKALSELSKPMRDNVFSNIIDYFQNLI